MFPVALVTTLTVAASHNLCTVSRWSTLRRTNGPLSGVLAHTRTVPFGQRRSARRCHRYAYTRW